VARDEDGGLGRHASLILVGDEQLPQPLSFLLCPVANGPVDRFSRLAETGRPFDEQASNVLAVLSLEPPKEEPLDDSRSRALASSVADRLTQFLDWIDRFFGDAGMADRTLFPRAFGLETPAPLWTAPAFDRCLLLASIYPIATIAAI
jgi:hypothetical protein